MTYKQLPAKELSKSIRICQSQDTSIILVNHKTAEAAISLFGGQLLSYRPTKEKDIVWLSELALFDKTKPIRGGIPICWPWFGNTGGEQTHGFARNIDWALTNYEERDEGVTIVLELSDNDETRAIWPNKFHNALKFEIGNKLTVSLTSTNADKNSWSYNGALHSYLTVGDISKTSVTGMGHQYIDGVQGYVPMEGQEILNFDSETIHIYTAPRNPISINDQTNQREIKVINDGHDSAVIWNPWKQQATNMADMNDNDYKSMLCVESAIYNNSITLAPGESYTLSTTLTTEKEL